MRAVAGMRTKLVLLLLALGSWQFGEASYIAIKARLAQRLIDAAWSRAQQGVPAPRPWPWADAWPVAKLSAPRQKVAFYVLSDASGRTLAFGPGHLSGTAPPGRSGNSVISGHRDTHFAFLERVQSGEEIVLELPDGSLRRYRVNDAVVVDRRDLTVISDSVDERITLLTCFPFRAIAPRGPLRYAVTATRV